MSATRVLSALRSSAHPFLPSSRDYRELRRSWRTDVIAGVTVGIVALPLALAFGISSGAGAEAGLVTAVVAGVVAAVFGGSHVQVSGPTGAMVVVLAPIVAAHGAGAVAAVSVLAGVLVVAAGLLRLGRTVRVIPWPVIEGFTLGIAVIIFLQQVPASLGVSGGPGGSAVPAAVAAFAKASWPGALWSLAAVGVVALVMVIGPRISGRIPTSIIGIAVVTLLAMALDAPLATIGMLPDQLPVPAVPDLSPSTVIALAPAAVTVAALAAIESLLSARVAASMSTTGPVEPDRELVGQGLASLASGFFGGMPATGAIARTAVNVRSGARTRMAAVVHAALLLTVVLVGASVVSHIPVAALAGVLVVTSTKMVSLGTARSVLGSTRADAVIFVLTALVTITFDLVVAVGIGLVVAAFFALRSVSRASGVHREPIDGPPRSGDDKIAVYRLDGALFFGAAERLLDEVGEAEGVEVVIIRMSGVRVLDATGARVLADISRALERRGVTVIVKGVSPRHVSLLTRVGAVGSLRHPNHLVDDLESAVAHARSHVAPARTRAVTTDVR